jgi:hypothetical protein
LDGLDAGASGFGKRYAGVDRDAVGLAPGADRFGFAGGYRDDAHGRNDNGDDDDDDEDFLGSTAGRAASGGSRGEKRGRRRRQHGSATQAARSADSNSTTTSTAAASDDSGQSQPAYATRNARAARKDPGQRGFSASTYGTGAGAGSAHAPLSASFSSGAASASTGTPTPSGSSSSSASASGARGGRQRTGEYITSTFRGVYGRSSAKASGVRWAAHASDGKRKVHLGYFNSAEEAAVAYDTAVIRFKGPTAITNFRYDARGNRVDA